MIDARLSIQISYRLKRGSRVTNEQVEEQLVKAVEGMSRDRAFVGGLDIELEGFETEIKVKEVNDHGYPIE